MRLLDAFVRLLLVAHPKETRERYGEDIRRTIEERVMAVRRARGVFTATALVLRECFGIVASGLARTRARRRTRVLRPKRGAGMLEAIVHNVRLSARSLLRQPVFTLVAVLALGLGIGSTIAIFTVFHAVLLRPLPFHEPERLLSIWEKNPERGWHQAQVAAANYLDWRAESRSFDDMAAHNDWISELVLLTDARPAVVNAVEVTGNFFGVLGVAPLAGRAFEDGHSWAPEEHVAPVVLLSHGFWMRHFGGDVEALGGVLTLSGIDREILGVMPEAFAFPFAGTDVWVPTAWEREWNAQAFFRRAHALRVIGRLAPGVSREVAESELAAIASRLEGKYPETNTLMGTGTTPLSEWISGDATRPLQILLAAVSVLLLIACANVANMLLARATSRQQALQIRSALGCGRKRLVFEGLVGSSLLSLVGGVLGLALASISIRPLLKLSPEGLPRMEEIAIDVTIVLFALGVSLLAGALVGCLPAWRGASAPSGLRGGSRRTSRTSTILVAAEVALTLPLVIGAGLLVRSLAELSRVEPGFSAEHVLVARLSLPATRYEKDERVARFYRELLESVGTLPGVQSASTSSRLPFGDQRWSSDFTAEGWPADRFGIDVRHDEVAPGLFRTLSVPVIRGRDFDERDGLDAPAVVIINDALARMYFPDEDPIGKRVTFDRVPDESSYWRTIVGVVGNVRRESLAREEAPSFYAPVLQDTTRGTHLLVRTESDPSTFVSAVRERVRALDPALPLFDVTTLEAVVSGSLARERFLLSLLGTAAVIALALASVGIFGVVYHQTTRRVREIGIRVALGARGGSVVALVVGDGLKPVVAGIASGVLAAGVAVRALSSLLFEVRPLDPLTFAAVVAIVLAAAIAACTVPARWASRLEAVAALRAE